MRKMNDEVSQVLRALKDCILNDHDDYSDVPADLVVRIAHKRQVHSFAPDGNPRYHLGGQDTFLLDVECWCEGCGARCEEDESIGKATAELGQHGMTVIPEKYSNLVNAARAAAVGGITVSVSRGGA